jgi:beta-mannanase
MINWQPFNRPLDKIVAGNYDAYLKTWARGAKAYGKPLYIRLMPEMNGNWVPWNGNPTNFKNAWKKIVTLFRTEGATNVKWVWSVNTTDEPRTATNKMENYYPGSSYVDILAIDGYNWGTSRTNTAWRSFVDTFKDSYTRITKLGTTQPVWITETASTELGGNKAEWIRTGFSTTAFPRLKMVVWFDENKETDWRVNSSAASLQAVKDELSPPAPLVVAGQ